MITFLFNEIDKHLSYMELNIIDFKQLNMKILCFSKDNDIFTDSLVLVICHSYSLYMIIL